MVTLPDRIVEKIDVGDCWEWMACLSPSGYGHVWHEGETHRAHRLVWGLLVGPILEGLELDHLCRNRGCVNPDHLEPVTHRENLRRGVSNDRKTHCPQGHPYAGDNLRIASNGQRVCLSCKRAANKRAANRRSHGRKAAA